MILMILLNSPIPKAFLLWTSKFLNIFLTFNSFTYITCFNSPMILWNLLSIDFIVSSFLWFYLQLPSNIASSISCWSINPLLSTSTFWNIYSASLVVIFGSINSTISLNYPIVSPPYLFLSNPFIRSSIFIFSSYIFYLIFFNTYFAFSSKNGSLFAS